VIFFTMLRAHLEYAITVKQNLAFLDNWFLLNTQTTGGHYTTYNMSHLHLWHFFTHEKSFSHTLWSLISFSFHWDVCGSHLPIDFNPLFVKTTHRYNC
jgi:hypothetical protein